MNFLGTVAELTNPGVIGIETDGDIDIVGEADIVTVGEALIVMGGDGGATPADKDGVADGVTLALVLADELVDGVIDGRWLTTVSIIPPVAKEVEGEAVGNTAPATPGTCALGLQSPGFGTSSVPA